MYVGVGDEQVECISDAKEANQKLEEEVADVL
jgi:hypothetical protein